MTLESVELYARFGERLTGIRRSSGVDERACLTVCTALPRRCTGARVTTYDTQRYAVIAHTIRTQCARLNRRQGRAAPAALSVSSRTFQTPLVTMTHRKCCAIRYAAAHAQ